MMLEPERIEVFYGEAHEALARVYVRPVGNTVSSEMSISGTISGPHCIYARTLPSHFRLAKGSGDTEPLAESVVTDPCFWSPAEPYLYTARVSVRQGEELVTLRDQVFGIRRFGVRGNRLYLDGKNWVARIVACDEVEFETLPRWREAGATLLVESPSNELCEAASQIGVLVVAGVRGETAHLVVELRRLARFAAVGMALVEPSGPVYDDLRDACPNIVLAANYVGKDEERRPLPAWAGVAVIEHSDPQTLARLAVACPLPVIVRRSVTWPRDVADIEIRRAACDALQVDLAGFCDPVGYCV
jgi:Glycosyl hydrolases family 2